MTNLSNNLGAISALKGYRVQFLYTLYRILTYNESEYKFHPEGRFEDIDIYNHNNDVEEIIQVKHLGKVITLSDVVTTRKENTFLRRAIEAYNEGYNPIIKLVSFGEINDDVKNLTNSNYSAGLIDKLKKQGLNKKEIEVIKGHFKYEIVSEQEIKKEILLSLDKWGCLVDFEMTFDLLIYWIYYSAERQIQILPKDFKGQFEKICKYQRERISFSKTFNSLIQLLDNNIQEENIDLLKQDFYKGISATYKHILADVDVVRIDKLNLIRKKFNSSNIVFIHGASGQGKSTLAYRFLKENCSETTVYELKHLPENITTIYNVINSLEGISKGIRFPITIYIDVEPGNKEWINILMELSSKKNFNFLVTIREEDWNSIEVGDKFNFSELELSFEQGEAESIYKSLDYYNKDLKFVNFQNAWDNFGGKGPLMEFVYLITQNESITAKLSYQIKKILIDSSDVGKEKIRLLRYTVLADSYGSKVKLKELNQFLQLKNDIVFLISLLQKEYLIKISGDNSHIIGLHPVRSKIIKDLLFDNEINKESDFVLDALSFINDNTVLNFLRNAFFYGGLLPDKLIERLKFFKPQTWQMYLQIFRGLLWKGIFDYTEKNIGILNEVYSDYGKSWITVVNFDFANNIDGGSMMQNVDIFTDEQKQYAKSINKKFSDKVEIFSYCKDWLSRINTIEIIPIGNVEWNSFGLFLFWLDYFGYNSIELNLSKFEFEKDLSLHSLDSISHTLYGIKKYNNQSYSYVDLVENIFLHKLSEKYNIICIEKHEDDISFHYLLDIVDDKFETEESDFLNAISMEVINLLRFAFPEKKQYNSNCVGHKFSFLPSEYDSSIKRIPQKNLPLKPLIEINSTYLNLFNYSKRPKSWEKYVKDIISRRLLFNDIMSKMVKAFYLYHRQKHLKPLATFVHDYTENFHQKFKEISVPKLPQNVIDLWGEYGEGNAKKIKSNFDSSSASEINEEYRQLLALKRYSDFVELYRIFDNSLENFLWQSVESIYRKIRILLNEDVSDLQDNSRIALVGNLFKAFEIVSKYQKEFRKYFDKFVEPVVLKRIETAEIENISILSVLYRQFIYSDSFIIGNAAKIAINRVKEIESNFRNNICNGLRKFAKENDVEIKIEFDEKSYRCIILIDYNNTIETFQLVELIYNKLFDLIGQPDYNSIKYLLLNTKYPTFNVVLQVYGKSINSTWYIFKAYNLRERMVDELDKLHFIPHKIPIEYVEKYTIKSWNTELTEFINLDKLLESTSMVHLLAFQFSQLEYFNNKTIEDYNEKILKNYLDKTGGLFQKNLQKSLDLITLYMTFCDQGKIKFVDDDEKLEFFKLLIDNHKYFYPNDSFFEKGEIKTSLGVNQINEWIPRLEQLVNAISVIYYFLAGKFIEKSLRS